MVTDLTVAGILNFKIGLGETVQVTITAKDKNGDVVDMTGATLEDMILYRRTTTNPTETWVAGVDVTIVAGNIVINTDKSDIGERGTIKYKLPVRPAGGGRGVITGKITVQ